MWASGRLKETTNWLGHDAWNMTPKNVRICWMVKKSSNPYFWQSWRNANFCYKTKNMYNNRARMPPPPPLHYITCKNYIICWAGRSLVEPTPPYHMSYILRAIGLELTRLVWLACLLGTHKMVDKIQNHEYHTNRLCNHHRVLNRLQHYFKCYCKTHMF